MKIVVLISANAEWAGVKPSFPNVVSDIVSEEGGEVYDQIQIFKARAEEFMGELVSQSPEWLRIVKLR